MDTKCETVVNLPLRMKEQRRYVGNPMKMDALVDGAESKEKKAELWKISGRSLGTVTLSVSCR